VNRQAFVSTMPTLSVPPVRRGGSGVSSEVVQVAASRKAITATEMWRRATIRRAWQREESESTQAVEALGHL